MKKIMITLCGILLFVGMAFAGRSAEDIKKATDFVSAGIAQGFLKVDVSSHKVWVIPQLWTDLDIDAKERLTLMILDYVDPEDKNSSLDIYDKQSGKHLASYGVWGGFRVF